MGIINIWYAVWVLNCVYIAIAEHVHKPDECDRTETWFRPGSSYIYTYTAVTESNFVGASASKSGLKYVCQVEIDVPRKCEALLKVSDCTLYERSPGPDDVYSELTSDSVRFNEEISRHPVYFKYDKGEILADSIVIYKDDLVYVVNIKKAIISALQLKIQEMETYEHPVQHVDIFGMCPTTYMFPEDKPNYIYTKRDITSCVVPQIYKLQTQLFSFIKTVYGGYKEDHVSEPFYPFGSTVDCQYKLNSEKQIETVYCLQQQVFRPTAYNGTVYATAMANISQFLELTEVLDLNSRRIDRNLEGRRTASILFEYEASTAVDVTKSQIIDRLHGMVESVTSSNLQLLPEQFHQLVKLLRETTSDILHSSMMEVWSCHGNTGDQCNQKHQMLEKDYYLDGLLSCGTSDCIAEFTHCLQQGHVSWFTSRYFMYDMAFNHDVSLQVLTGILELCKSRDRVSCWLPLSIMINKLTKTDMDLSQVDGPVYLSLLHLRQVIGDNCRTGIIQSLPKHRQMEEIDKLLLILKTLGNIGRPVQTVFDNVNIESKQLVSAILQCAKNTQLPKKIAKAAIQALTKLQVDQQIKENLLEITGDINRESVIRTAAFSKLLTTPDTAVAGQLIDLIHDEPMINMKTYMVVSLKSLLENDQPDLLQLRTLWQQAINDDGRPLPESQDNLFGKSRYMELSRYFKLPLSVNMSGFQIEFDIVYDPASPVVNSVVIRLNRYSGEKHNIIELGMDVEGLDMIMDAVVGKKGMGIYSLMKLLSKARQILQQRQQQHAGQQQPIFEGFDADVIQQIMSLFEKVNYPKMTIPEGMIHWKLYGNEVLYLEIKDIFKLLMGTESGQQHSGNSRVGQILQTLQQGLAIAKTRSAKYIDLNKVLPTVSGLPLNMTVLVTACSTVDVNVDADLRSFMRQVGPLTSSGSLSASLTGEFYGQLDVTLSSYYKAGIAMRMSALANAGLSATADFHRTQATPHILKNYRLEFDIQNIDNQFNIAHVRSKMYHVHNDETLEILADPDYQTAIRKCYTKIPYLLIGDQLCGNVLYPNVSMSTQHAYFPLSGPFSMDVYLQKADPNLQQFDLDVTYKQLNSTEGYISDKVDVTFTGQGQKLQRAITALMLFDRQQRDLTVDAEMPEAQTNFHLRYKHVLGRTLESGTRLYEFMYDVYLNRMSRYLLRTFLHYKRLLTAEQTTNSLTGELQSGNRTEQELSLMLAIPVANLHLEVYNMKENLATHYVTELNMTYFCSKTVPLLYMLHLNPRHAALHGDATRIEFSNDAQFGYTDTSFWNTTDNMYLKYPGQTIQLTNNMIANQTYAVRHTDITYLDGNQQQKTLKMKAHVENHTDATNLNYDYFMVMKNEDTFDITLQGHVYGNIRNFNLYTDVHFTKVTQDEYRRKRSLKHIYDKFEEIENGLQNRNSEDSQTSDGQTEGDNDSSSPVNTDTRPGTEMARRPQSLPYQCRSIFDWDRWNLTLNLTWQARPVFNPGSRIRIPIGGEFVWSFDLLYPSCNMYKQVLSSGALGRHINNTIFDFRYWINYLNLYKTHVVQQDGTLLETSSKTKTFDMNVRYQYHQHLEYTMNYRGRRLNGSLEIHYQRQTPTYAEITVHFHADSVWILLNYDHTELYIIRSIRPYGLSDIDHYLKLNHTLFMLKLNSTLHKNEDGITLNQNGTFIRKIPVVSSTTAITTHAGFSRRTLPYVSMTFTQPQMVYFLNVGLSHPRLLNITYSIQKNGFLLAPAITVLMEIHGSTSVQYTLSWHPALTASGKEKFKEKLAGISHMLLDASKTMLLNTQRQLPDIVIPFINKTAGSVVKRILYPFFMYLPLKGVPFGRSHGTLASDNTTSHASSGIKSGKKVLSLIMKISSDVLKKLGKSVLKPPAVIMPYLNNIIKPRLRQILMDNSVSFVLPLPFKWKHLMSLPEITQSQKYVQKLTFGIVAKLLRGSKQTTPPPEAESDIALVYGSGKYVSTFDGKVYHIPFSPGHTYNAECTYLLTSDFKDKNFALVLSNTGISIVTGAVTVTIDFHSRVYINQCTTAIDMPFTSTDNAINVFKNTKGIVLNTNFGVDILCSSSHDLSCTETHDVCSISVNKNHHNQTLGLFGTNDGEPGNDLRMPNRTMFTNIPQFLTGYALNGPNYCFHSDVAIDRVVCNVTRHKSLCNQLFENKTSQLVACFDRVDPDPFLNVCVSDAADCRSNICEHALAYITLCKSKGLDISIPTLPVDCTRNPDRYERLGNKKTLVDIVFVIAKDVISEHGGHTVISHLETFMHSFNNHGTFDIQVGVIGNSGNEVLTEGTTRHFLGLEYVSWRLHKTWIETEDTSIKTMLDMVAGHPFRYNSRRLVVLLTKQQSITRDEKRQLIDLYNNKKLRLHVMSEFTELKGRRVLGINYNKEVIFTTKRKKTSNLPKGPLMKLVEQTSGSVLDITPILKGQESRMNHIASHLMEEVKDFSCQIEA